MTVKQILQQRGQWKYDDSLFEKETEGGNSYERLKDVEYAKLVMDVFREVEEAKLKNLHFPTPYQSNEEYFQEFRVVSGAYNTCMKNNIKNPILKEICRKSFE